MSQAAVLPKSSALDALRALSQKKPSASNPVLSAQLTDPAIAGAKRDKNTVKLGFDPQFAEKAAYAAQLKDALDRATADFTISQAEMRDYGKDKRKVYNETFKCVITTVGVPYSVETPSGPETRYVQVICSNKYSVSPSVVNSKEEFGEWYPRLFTEERKKVIRSNAEELIKNLLLEAGVPDDEIDDTMNSLFEETVKVSANENYEQESAKAPQDIKTVLEQMVTRSQPGLKF